MQIAPQGKQLLLQMGKYCWGYLWTDGTGLVGWYFWEQPVLVNFSCFLRQNQFNQRQLNDLILKRQLSLGSRSWSSPGPYKHPNPPLHALSTIQCKNLLLILTLISILTSIIDGWFAVLVLYCSLRWIIKYLQKERDFACLVQLHIYEGTGASSLLLSWWTDREVCTSAPSSPTRILVDQCSLHKLVTHMRRTFASMKPREG